MTRFFVWLFLLLLFEEFVEAFRTDGAILDFASAVDEYVWAIYDELAVKPARVHGCFAAAIADSFELFDLVGEL